MLPAHLCSRLQVRTQWLTAKSFLTEPRILIHVKYSPPQSRVNHFFCRMASNGAAPATGTLSSPPKEGQIIQHEGKEYETVKEGLAYILTPRATQPPAATTTPNGPAESQRQPVFYNPIQQFNRDLSVLAIRAYGEHAIAGKHKKNAERQRAKARRESRFGNKRKRENGEEEGEGLKNEASTKKPRCGDQSDGSAQAPEAMPEKLPETSEGSTNAPAKPWVPSFTILDALSATGLRALRYAKEVPFANHVIGNDLSTLAIDSMKLNVQHNGVEDVVRPNKGDACSYMYSVLGPQAPNKDGVYFGKFDVIDLDPYGTAAPFLDAAIQSVTDGGLLCVTCTDAGVFAGIGYPEKTFSLYGGIPIKGPHSHEGGLRLILNAVALAGAKYGIAIEPLLSLSIDFYARVFVRVHRSPSEVKFTASKTMIVYNCDHGCGAWTTQRLGDYKQKDGKNGLTLYNHKLSQGPSATPNCEHCGFKTHLSGPMWAGPLHNPHFIQRILDLVAVSDKETYPTFGRIEGMLTTALEEDLDLGGNNGDSTPEPQPDKIDESAASSKLIPRADPARVDPHPFFFMPSTVCRVLRTSTMPEASLRGAFRHLGYRSTRSHTKPNSIRTDAPWSVIWEVMREWVRQKSPIKEGALSDSTAGAGIYRRSREKMGTSDGEGAGLRSLKRDILSAVDSGKNLSELTTKIEAALYRSGVQRPEEASSETPKTEDEKDGGNDDATKRPDTSTLEVIFDEELGKKAMVHHKKLVRYQINPRENWGPLARAPVSNAPASKQTD